jgi:murein L,D-transpeptidase YcbB/YkuD
MAEYLLRDQPEWTSEKITKAMNAGKEQYVTLKNTVPVYIAYITAFVSAGGQLNFRQDIYNRDDRLAKTIMQ